MEKLSMKIVNAHAAGIDIGSRFHMVAINQNPEQVHKFGVYTCDHESLIHYLQEHQIATVAMESTGSYWQTLFNALQKAGFEVLLVNSRHIKNVKGKKTDVIDCMWIQKLHSLGLLSGSFLLNDHLQTLRTYYVHRQYLIEQASKYINKMQKALRLMNIRLDVALNDITGKSGRKILNAILEGNRDPHQLASLVHSRVKKSKDEIAACLHGQWRDDLLFELQSCLFLHDMCIQEIEQCDRKMEASIIDHIPSEPQETEIKEPNKSLNKYSPSFNVRQVAFAYLKTDLYEIPGISHNTVLCLLSNMGTDIRKFTHAKQFASWLRLVPNNKVSGGKIVRNRTPKGKNRLALALRQAANSIGNQQNHPLTTFIKRIAYRKGRISAITATARKLAIIVWNMIIKQEPYKLYADQLVTEKQKVKQLKNIKQRLLRLNLDSDQLKKLFLQTSSSFT